MKISPLQVINGFVIQGSVIDVMTNNTSYRGGAYRKSWPLDEYEDTTSISLTRQMRDFFYKWQDNKFALWICPDVNLVRNYNNACQNLGLETRVLACTTTFNSGGMYHFDSTNILGWDHVSPSFDYSTLADDFSCNGHISLQYFSQFLNTNGMFDDICSLEKYISYRLELIAQGENLEKHDNLETILLREIRL
jgi:hypothetical protein